MRSRSAMPAQLQRIRPELYPHAQGDRAYLAPTWSAQAWTSQPDDAQPLYLRDRVALTVEERQAIKAQQARVRGDPA